MLEQQLINAFMKFTAKAGAGEFVRNLIWATDENGNPKVWTAPEMEQAIRHLNDRTEQFGREEALRVIETLMRKFSIRPEDLPATPAETTANTDQFTGVQGLQ